MVDRPFNNECIKEHNALRALHGSPALTFNLQLAKDAQEYAEHLVAINVMQHNTDRPDCGENLAYRTLQPDMSWTGQQVSRYWYSEIKDYDFVIEDVNRCGHFSQVVWAGTKEAGFGLAFSDDRRTVFAVGRYQPPGNFVKKWSVNIGRPVSGEVYLPTHEDCMGEQPKPKAGTIVVSSGDIKPLTNGPKHPDDKMVGRSKKTKTINGAKIEEITETYRTPMGDQYTVTVTNNSNQANAADNDVIVPKRAKANFANPDGPDDTETPENGEYHEHMEPQQYDEGYVFGDLEGEGALADLNPEDEDGHVHAHTTHEEEGQPGELLDFSHEDELEHIHGDDNIYVNQQLLDINPEEEGFEFRAELRRSSQDNLNDDELYLQQNPYTEPEQYDTNEEQLEREMSELEEFRNLVQQAHNDYRERHGVVALQRNPELDDMAQRWAENLLEKDVAAYSNSRYNDSEIGENIAIKLVPGLRIGGDHLIANWYSKGEPNFDYGVEPKDILQTGHFTQVVWAKTQEIGVGLARSVDKAYIVCFYYPPGNVRGEFAEEVHPPLSY